MDGRASTGIVIIGAAFVDIKGYPHAQYIPGGRNSGHVVEVHGGVGRNIAEDISNVELRPTFVTIVDKSALGEDVIQKLERFAFYEEAKKAYAIIATTETSQYANVILQKGCVL